MAVAYRAGWDRRQDGSTICLNKANTIELLKAAGSKDLFDDLDRVAICEAEMLLAAQERQK